MLTQGCRWVFKSEDADSCSETPNSGGAKALPAPPLTTVLLNTVFNLR